jgi:hypothetical protein
MELGLVSLKAELGIRLKNINSLPGLQMWDIVETLVDQVQSLNQRVERALVDLDLAVARLVRESTASQRSADQTRVAVELQGQKMVETQSEWVLFKDKAKKTEETSILAKNLALVLHEEVSTDNKSVIQELVQRVGEVELKRGGLGKRGGAGLDASPSLSEVMSLMEPVNIRRGYFEDRIKASMGGGCRCWRRSPSLAG